MVLQHTKKLLYSVLAFLMLGLGISLQIKAGIGQSMFNAFSLILADLFSTEVGTVLNFLNLLFFMIYLVIRQSRFNRRDFVQIAATIANGYIINFFIYYILSNFAIESYFLRALTFIFGLILASLSLGTILAIKIIQFPLESLCIELGRKLGYTLTKIRMTFDVFFLVSTLMLTAIFSRSLYIREGTIISFFLLSRLMGASYYFHKKHL